MSASGPLVLLQALLLLAAALLLLQPGSSGSVLPGCVLAPAMVETTPTGEMMRILWWQCGNVMVNSWDDKSAGSAGQQPSRLQQLGCS